MKPTSFKDVGAVLKITNGCKVTVLSEPVSTEAEFNGKKSTQYFIYGDIDGKTGSFRLPAGVIKSARTIALAEGKEVFDLAWKISWNGDGLLRKYTVYPAGEVTAPSVVDLEINIEKVKTFVTKLENRKVDKQFAEVTKEVKSEDVPF